MSKFTINFGEMEYSQMINDVDYLAYTSGGCINGEAELIGDELKNVQSVELITDINFSQYDETVEAYVPCDFVDELYQKFCNYILSECTKNKSKVRVVA